MASMSPPMPGDGLDLGHRRRRGDRSRTAWMIGGGLVLAAALAAVMLLRGETVSERPGEQKIVRVVLPPPPPPPPPPEPKPDDTPPEPKPTPVEQPQDAPPPPTPTPQSDPAPGNDALTARQGAGPSNYGLAVGDGGGTRIGGKAGGNDGFAAYANVAVTDIRRAAQNDAALSRGRYAVRLLVAVDTEGRITSVRLIGGSGDDRRDAAIERRLIGLQLSQRPPAGLPAMRIELNTRSGA